MVVTTINHPQGNVEIDIPESGAVPCFARGLNTFFDEEISCVLFQLPFFLETIGFGYICVALTLCIILISIFGGIKENYRWFVLNQAFWDLLVAYNFICHKPTQAAWFSLYDPDYASKEWNQGPPTCFYYFGPNESSATLTLIGEFFKISILNASYVPLFLLTFSRALGLYFHHFYERHSTKRKIFFIIVIFTFLVLLVATLASWLDTYVISVNFSNAHNSCFNQYKNETDFYIYNSLISKCMEPYDFTWITRYLHIIQVFIPSFLLASSIIFAFLLILKISTQLQYQLRHNRANFILTLRIAIVITFQCAAMAFLFFCSIFHTYWSSFATGSYEYLDVPAWLTAIADSDASYQCFMIIRIFLDSVIVILVLTEYRKAVINFVKFVFLKLRHPKEIFKRLKGKIFGTPMGSVTNVKLKNRNISFVTSTTSMAHHR